jgi:dTDP-4-dehydrorhamnose reductase
MCEQRNLSYRVLTRQEMDVADLDSVERAMALHQPWAVINASGYVRVDEAERDRERCFRENAIGPAILAGACGRHRVQLLTFSSDLVFDGRSGMPYVETDRVRPINVYGESKARGEREVLERMPGALVIRTSSFFGPWDQYNFVTQVLAELAAGRPFVAARDVTVSPTYVPDLVHTCLDLLVDRESGIWHLTNGQPVTWLEFALKVAEAAGADSSRLEGRVGAELGWDAPRPAFSALHSERGILLRGLDDAIGLFLDQREFGKPLAQGGAGLL